MRSMHVRRWAVGLGLSGALVAGCHLGPGIPDGQGLPGAGADGGSDLVTDGGAPDGATDGAIDGTTDGTTDGPTDGATDGTTDGAADDVVVPTPLQAQLVAEVNEVRTAGTTCGGVAQPAADPLTLDDELAVAAQGHADWIAETGRFGHAGEGGSTGGERITAAGYAWDAWGENIAFGQTSVEAVVAAWFASADHCTTFMDPRFEEVGFGRATASSGTQYWVADLASPA